jgi:Fur family ferric uptake transcriptional regulator
VGIDATISHVRRAEICENGPVSSRSDSSPRVLHAAARLRAHHERVTKARVAVLEVLDQTSAHLNADEIVHRAEAIAPGVHRATVYRALATLGDLDLVTHTHIGGSATVYHLAGAEHDHECAPHVHLQCTSCGAVLDVPAAALQPLVAKVREELGFRLEPEHAALLGICADCGRAQAERSPDRLP